MMVRKGKWVADASADEPLAEVARRALAVRLYLVWRYLPRAADNSEDPENVHQLRVSTRRAMAAMQIFDAVLPPRRALWMNKQLKRVRQAAGAARDLDVLAARFEQWGGAAGPYRAQVKRIAALRDEAQAPIEQVRRKLAHKDFPHRQAALVERVRLRSKAERLLQPTFGQAARRALRLLVDDFFAAAGADFDDDAALHAFRIQGKQLRYALEIFAGAFDRSLRNDVYPVVETLQEKLGPINDHATAKELFAGWLNESDDDPADETLPRLVAEESAALAAARQEFFAWWTPERAHDLRRQFSQHLGNPDREQTA